MAIGDIAEDRTQGHVNKLTNAMDRLSESIGAQGIGLSEKVDFLQASVLTSVGMVSAKVDQLAKAINRASAASDRHARRLVWATWGLVIATTVLVLVTGVLVYVTWAEHALTNS